MLIKKPDSGPAFFCLGFVKSDRSFWHYFPVKVNSCR